MVKIICSINVPVRKTLTGRRNVHRYRVLTIKIKNNTEKYYDIFTGNL